MTKHTPARTIAKLHTLTAAVEAGQNSGAIANADREIKELVAEAKDRLLAALRLAEREE